MTRPRRLDIDNTNGYKRSKDYWIVRYKSISGYRIRKALTAEQRAAKLEAERQAEREAARRAGREAAIAERNARLSDTVSVERTISQAQRRIAAGSRRSAGGGRRAQAGRRAQVGHAVRKFREADWVVIGICAFVFFSIVFMFNALRGNRAVEASSDDMRSNIAYIRETQAGDIEDIEDAVSRLEEINAVHSDDKETERAKYMRLMSDSVVVGDSLTEGLIVYGWLSDGQVFSEIGASLMGSGDMFEKAAALHPKNAFFAFGMNDMGNYGKDPERFIERYNELLDGFAKASPKTRIFICSISVPADYAISRNKSISYYKEYNEALKKMAKDRGVTYVDSTSIFIEHPELYAGDGIHAQPSYYPYWLDNMVRATVSRESKSDKDKTD